MTQEAYLKLLGETDKFQEILDKEEPIKLVRARTEYDELPVKDFAQLFYHTVLMKARTDFSEVPQGQASTMECSAGRMRSIDDTYLVCRYYNIDITLAQLKEVFSFLYTFKPKAGGYSVLSNSWCSTVHKKVHTPYLSLTLTDLTKILEDNKMNYQKRVLEAVAEI